ncbi:MAG: hypothetical protein K0U47_12080 [Epsilonproteobacteria bacterium]|nr:hypothetical protein [Campylobacterota bacterium]
MKKELIIFLVIFLILAIGQHPDFLTSPLERIVQLPQAGAYGLGAVHPLVFGLVGYLFVWIIRGVIIGFKKIFKRG